MRNLDIIGRFKIWVSISLIIIVVGIVFAFINGFNIGIDFKGGVLVNIDMKNTFNKEEVDEIVKKYASDAVTNTVNETQIEIKSNILNTEITKEMFDELKEKYSLPDDSFLGEESVGSTVGKELTRNSLIALLIATIGMLLYIILRFEYKFAIAAIIATIHDILITIAVYAIFKIPINMPFIAAVLTIIGYSVNDTIVIFDRIRENKRNLRKFDAEEIANKSVNQTMTRSINTTLTTLLTITCVYIFVPPVRDFSFPLIIGIVAGAYSSIFMASPIWAILTNKIKPKAKTKIKTV